MSDSGRYIGQERERQYIGDDSQVLTAELCERLGAKVLPDSSRRWLADFGRLSITGDGDAWFGGEDIPRPIRTLGDLREVAKGLGLDLREPTAAKGASDE